MIPIGTNPTDLSINYAERRLYVSNWRQPQTRVVDLERQEEIPPLPLGLDVYRLNAGRQGRVLVEGQDQWVNLTLYDTSKGLVLATTTVREGDGEMDPNGLFYFHCDNNSSGAALTKFALTNDTLTVVATGDGHPFGTRNLLLSPDGSKIFLRGFMHDAQSLQVIRSIPDEFYATTRRGEIAFSNTKAYNTSSGEAIYNLPVESTVMAISRDQDKLFLFEPQSARLRVIPMTTISRLPTANILPTPADGEAVSLPLGRLDWTSSAQAFSYRVYLGASKEDVATADTNSTLFRGEVATAGWVITNQLAASQTYYWRVDLVGLDTAATGKVWSFIGAPFRVSTNQLDLKGVVGARRRIVPLEITSGGTPIAWSVSTTAPWLTLSPKSGSTPAILQVTIESDGQMSGEYTNRITIAADNVSINVPIRMKWVRPSLTKMLADIDRPYIYAIHEVPNSTDESLLVFINTVTDQMEKAIPIGNNATDLTISYADRRLYVSNWSHPQTRVVELTTQEEVEPLSLGADVYVLNAGRSGRLFVEGQNQWVNLTLYDTAAGQQLFQYFPLREGDGEVDLTGRFYYHCDNGTSGSALTKFAVANDRFTILKTTDGHPMGSRHLLLSPDGSKLFLRGYVHDTSDLNVLGSLGEEIYATTLHGEVAFSSTKAYNTANGIAVYTLPITTTVMAVSRGQDKLFLFDPQANGLRVIPMHDIDSVAGPAPLPTPADREPLSLPLTQLKWTTDPLAFRYRVYLSADRQIVSAATTNSAAFLGEVSAPQIALTNELAQGQNYFWRVDSVRFNDTSIGAVWSFTVAPFQIQEKQLDVKWVTGAPKRLWTLNLTSLGTSAAWTASNSAPWLALSTNVGFTPGKLEAIFDGAGLSPGVYTNSVAISASGVSVQVPVRVELVKLALSKIIADLERPYLYALHPGLGTFEDAFLVFVNTSTDRIENVIPIGSNPTDLTINYPEKRLCVSNWGHAKTRVVDLNTQGEIEPLLLGNDVYKLNAGARGQLFVEGEDQWVSVRNYSTGNGTLLADIVMREGDGEVDSIQRYYYHCDNNSSPAGLTKFLITGDRLVRLDGVDGHGPGSRNLLLSPDRSKLFLRGFVHDTSDLHQIGSLGDEIYTCTTDGHFAFSSTKVFDTTTQKPNYALPFETSVLAVAATQDKLFLFNRTNATFTVVPMLEITNLAPNARNLTLSTLEDTAQEIALEASDPENDPFEFSIVSGPAHGALSGVVPRLAYLPAANYFGADSFSYVAKDRFRTSTVAAVTINVAPVNDAPTAVSQAFRVAKNVARQITIEGRDLETAVLTYQIVNGPFHGRLDGFAPKLRYAPNAGYTGVDSFQFTVSDGALVSPTATITLQIAEPACTRAAPGLTVWWPAEENLDDLRGGNLLQPQGVINYLPAKVGRGFSFEGTNTFLEAAASPTLDIGGGDGFTIEGWVQPTTLKSNQTLLAWTDTNGLPGLQ